MGGRLNFATITCPSTGPTNRSSIEITDPTAYTLNVVVIIAFSVTVRILKAA